MCNPKLDKINKVPDSGRCHPSRPGRLRNQIQAMEPKDIIELKPEEVDWSEIETIPG
jgi:hypothetical protein